MQSAVTSSRCLRAPIAPGRAALRPKPSLVLVSAAVVNSNDFRNGTAIEIDGVPYKVSESDEAAITAMMPFLIIAHSIAIL